MPKHHRRASVVTAAMLLVVAACGGGDGSSVDTAPNSPAPAGSEESAALPPQEFSVRGEGDTTFEQQGVPQCSGDGTFSIRFEPDGAGPDLYVFETGPVGGTGTYDGTLVVSPDSDAVPLQVDATLAVEKAEPDGSGFLTALSGTLDASVNEEPLGATDLAFEWKCWVYADELEGG